MRARFSHHPNRSIPAAAALVWVMLIHLLAPCLAAPPAFYDFTPGGLRSFGAAVNDAGQVAGTAGAVAFRYDPAPSGGGVMHFLTPGAFKQSSGYGINNTGQVTGWTRITISTFPPATHAFLHTGTPGAGGQMIDLDDWLDANIPTEGAKWTLAGSGGGPSDISNTGWITGTGIYDPDGPSGVASELRAYLLDASALVPSRRVEPPSSF